MFQTLQKLIILVLFIIPSLSIHATQFLETRSIAVGGAMRSAYALNESLYSNPAAPAFLKNYSVEGTYQVNNHPLFDKGGNTYALSIVDNSSSAFAAGIGYLHRELEDTKTSQTDKLFSLNVSKALSPNLAIGAGGKYFGRTTNDTKTTQYNTDIGVLFLINDFIKLGALGQNIVKDKSNTLFTEIGGGIGLNILNQLLLYSDYVKRLNATPNDQYSIHIGGEWIRITDLVVRAGWSLDKNTDQKFYSGGIGWIAPKLAIFYSYQHAFEGAKQDDHSFSLRIFF